MNRDECPSPADYCRRSLDRLRRMVDSSAPDVLFRNELRILRRRINTLIGRATGFDPASPDGDCSAAVILTPAGRAAIKDAEKEQASQGHIPSSRVLPTEPCEAVGFDPDDPFTNTVSGRKMYFLHPTADSVCLEDIATGLSNQCRFSGQVPFSFSIGQHSLLCADAAKRGGYNVLCQLYCLMHDAAEAYTGDLPAPLKHLLPPAKIIETNIQAAIWDYLGVGPPPYWHKVEMKKFDNRATASEAAVLQPGGDFPGAAKSSDWMKSQVVGRSANIVRSRFLERARTLWQEVVSEQDRNAEEKT